MSRIISSVPGRIRLRDKILRDPIKLNELKKALSQIAVITSLQGNARTGSLLLYFDRNSIALSTMEANIDSTVEQIIGQAPKPQFLLSKKNFTRYNKMAMLASLGASLIALRIERRKSRIRWHQLTGYLFIANLGVHLFFYRRALRRTFR
ncbi:hypothetical protein AU255_06165 [Methyloprofundus sedimenti]|uniref:Uncharacterized protein n=1 Tax=Methyloprofundus sedimenti TaxID=1420851 RepID=A0A1V8M7B0_9GAMM|nr:hypothetical protein [Methyloprofundus sedimenti]OQK17461.1 hypothetical protein AU255_06165 [Methyloprofundus sedimenti]